MTDYIAIEDELDADQAEEEIFDELATAFPGWEAQEAQPEVWLVRGYTRLLSAIFVQTGVVSEEIFKRFGQAIIGVDPIDASSATVDSTWTAIDNAGYTIPDGTQVAIPESGSVSHGFVTVGDVTIAPGATATTAGEVSLRALVAGEAANGLTEDAELQDALEFIDQITLNGNTTSGGVDSEDSADYLDRLTETLRVLTLTPVIPRDVEILARSVAGVSRVTAIDGFNPLDDTTNNERMVHVVGIDEDGSNLSSDKKDEIDDLLQEHRELTFSFSVGDATVNTIYVASAVAPYAGWATADVQANAAAKLTEYLLPSNWGLPRFGELAGGGWRNETVLRRNELLALVDQADGVDYVSDLYVGSATKSVTGVAATDVITSTSHGYSDGDRVVFATKTGGTGLTTTDVYFVRDSATNTFKLAATAGGSAINFTTDISAGTTVKLSTADVTLTGVAPLTTAGTLVISIV